MLYRKPPLEGQEPIRINFDRQLRRIQRDVLRMGALVENSFCLAREALFDRNLEAAEQIHKQDKKIDRLYKQIELDCVNLIALQSPVAQDLRLLSALMQLVRDLERIGDYAKNLGDVAVQLFPYSDLPHTGQIRVMFDRCRAMLALSLESLSNLDEQASRDVRHRDDAVDSDYNTLYALLAKQKNVPGMVEPIVLQVLIIRHLERMADHAANIGKRVSYIVTGQR
jgi:phosphate transport system protein